MRRIKKTLRVSINVGTCIILISLSPLILSAACLYLFIKAVFKKGEMSKLLDGLSGEFLWEYLWR